MILFKAWRMEDNNSWDKQMALFRSVSLTFQLHLCLYLYASQGKAGNQLQLYSDKVGGRDWGREGGKENNKILDT